MEDTIMKISNFNSQISNVRNGFTIIELLVAMGIFVLLLGVVVGIFLNALRTQRSLVALMAANDNASLALEQMMREIRTGSGFCIASGNGCSASPVLLKGSAIRFTNASDATVIYQHDSANKTILRSGDGGVSFLAITGNNVEIRNLNFILQTPDPVWPPRITLAIRVGLTDPNLASIANDIQTTVSAREI